jgi:hypothetical protein
MPPVATRPRARGGWAPALHERPTPGGRDTANVAVLGSPAARSPASRPTWAPGGPRSADAAVVAMPPTAAIGGGAPSAWEAAAARSAPRSTRSAWLQPQRQMATDAAAALAGTHNRPHRRKRPPLAEPAPPSAAPGRSGPRPRQSDGERSCQGALCRGLRVPGSQPRPAAETAARGVDHWLQPSSTGP